MKGLERGDQSGLPQVKNRCAWCGNDPLYVAYHDEEWGVPMHDDRRLFEMLVLEGAQAGLSWLTILRKRENYRRAFEGFDPEIVARYTATDVQRLLGDPGIVRNRLKIESAIRNARGVLAIIDEQGSLDAFLWQFVDGVPRQNAWKSLAEVPSKTAESDRMSRALQRRGLNFVGSTICYAFMQSVGMVNDHVVGCFLHRSEDGARMQDGAE
jgi:DNA-3-methyladenine glycosylase I